MHTQTHLHTHISNQFIQFVGTLLGGFPAQFQEIKENYQNLTIKNSMEQMFLKNNRIKWKSFPILLCPMTLATVEERTFCDILSQERVISLIWTWCVD